MAANDQNPGGENEATSSTPAPTAGNGDQSELPWWKRHQKAIFMGLILIIVGLIAAVVAVVVTKNNSNNNEATPSDKLAEDGGQSQPSTESPIVASPTVSPETPLPTPKPTEEPSPESSELSVPSPGQSNNLTIPPYLVTGGASSLPPAFLINGDDAENDAVGPTSTPASSKPTPSAISSLSTPPTSERFIATIEKLTPLSGDALKNVGSFQYKAARWISELDERNLDLNDPSFEQRYIMALFYYAMDGNRWVNNEGWLGYTSECFWFGIDGVRYGCGGEGSGGCLAKSDNFGDYDKICMLDMGRLNNLYGEIPSEMGYLSEMRYFGIQDDYLVGTLPESIGAGWTKLHTFLVGGNFIEGGFPSTFTGNEFLGTIFIDRNRFNGTFPNVFTTLKNLEWLDAEENGFTGNLPEAMAELKSLRILNVNNNSLTGFLPDSWDEANLLEDFEVSNNRFNGGLPTSLGSVQFLKDLHVSNNMITGSIPESYYQLFNLEELYLDENDLSGGLPQTPEPLYEGLQEFSIHSNSFTGRFPVENFESTLRLKVLSLHGNQLTGTITDNICQRLDPSLSYTRLAKLSVDCDLIACDCCVCYVNGEIVSESSPPTSQQTPPTISSTINPTESGVGAFDGFVSRPTRAPDYSPPADRESSVTEQIESLVLQRGAVFDEMGKTDPRYLALDWILFKDEKQLTTDDENLSQRYVLALIAFSLDSLAWFVCGDHRFIGDVIEFYAVETCLVEDMTGHVEEHKVWLSSTDECEWYGVICSNDGVVKGLELIGNDLIGEIPPEISQLNFLQYLAFNGNCLYGKIPSEFGQMPHLLSLELHGNGLSGKLPPEIYDSEKLQLLNVAMNYGYFSYCQRSNGSLVYTSYAMGGDGMGGGDLNLGIQGVLSNDLSQWVDLKGLHVFDNSFYGEIPSEIGTLENLTFLRAHNNLFSGYIPNTITNLQILRELYLNENSLFSDIPPDIGNMIGLEDIRVYENELFGDIPDSFYNLQNMKKVWFQDTTYCSLIDSSYLCNVNKDYGLTGSIKTEIGNLAQLSMLILNNNPLTGTLPTELGLCEELSILHIHHTNIEGTVPDEVCRLRDKELNSDTSGVFYADCRPNNMTGNPFIECSCCTDCCDHTTTVCIADD